MAYKVLIPQDIAVEGKEYLLKRGYEVKMGSGVTEEDLIRDVADCDAILLRTAQITREVLESAKHLKIVARHGAGYNNVDLAAAEELGIWVTNAPDSTTTSVAEFTIGAMVAAAKKTFFMSGKMKEGDFFYKNSHKGVDLAHKTLSVIGFGRIGKEVARKAHAAFDMKIVAYDPYVNLETVPEYVKMAEWDEAFSEGDFVSLHMPLTNTNRGTVGNKEFVKMKDTAFFINCARGELVNEEDMAEAVKNNLIAGVFTDVLCQEPPNPHNQLLSLEDVIVTPHMASNTEECMILMAVQAASQIDLVLSDENPVWAVNKPYFVN